MAQKRKITLKTKKLILTYYELENTVDEYHSRVTGRYTTFEAAKEDLKNHCDWYCSLGTGRICKVEIFKIGTENISIERKIVFWRSQSDILNGKVL